MISLSSLESEYATFSIISTASFFVLYVLGAIYMFKKLQWSFPDLFIVIACSVLPFGPFYVERKYL